MNTHIFSGKRYLLILISILVIFGAIFSYKITEVPLGFNADEASIGFNAVFIADTLHDENGRFLPFFILTLNKTDWKQPVTVYYTALLFKLFGPSTFLLRFGSTLITLAGTALVYFLSSLLLDRKKAIIASIIFATTPIVMIQSHLAIENVMPIPACLIWLLSLFFYQQKKQYRYLIPAAIAMGVGFYAYKGMRATVPVWSILTILYLMSDFLINHSKQSFIRGIKASLVYSLTILPFFAIIPLLEIKYANAVFDKAGYNWQSLYLFLYPWFASFDLSFLYIQGDATPYHSTGQHGMMLLASLPFFIVGAIEAFRKKGFWWLILISFFTATLLFGFVNTVHRASRMMVVTPQYALITTLGVFYLWGFRKKVKKSKYIIAAIILLISLNYLDFVTYYWNTYPQKIKYLLDGISDDAVFQALAEQSKQRHLTPYLSSSVVGGAGGDFFQANHFHKLLPKIDEATNSLPNNGILLTQKDTIPGLQELPLHLRNYHLFIKP